MSTGESQKMHRLHKVQAGDKAKRAQIDHLLKLHLDLVWEGRLNHIGFNKRKQKEFINFYRIWD